MLEHDGVLEVGFVGFHSVYRMVNQTRQRTGWSELFVLLLILRSRSSALRVRPPHHDGEGRFQSLLGVPKLRVASHESDFVAHDVVMPV